MSDIQKFDNFWKTPEGKFTKTFQVILAIGIGTIIYFNGPEILNFFDTLKKIAIAVVVTGAIGIALSDESFRTRLLYGYKILMKKVSKLFITIDPILTLEVYIDRMRDNLKKVSQNITQLNGQKTKLAEIIKQKRTEIDQTFRMSAVARESGMDAKSKSQARMTAKTQEATDDYQILWDKINHILIVLEKMEENCLIIIEEQVHSINILKERFEIISKSNKAIKSAWSIFRKDADREIFDEAKNELEDELSMMLGEMERIMGLSQDITETIDLKNMMYDQKGMEALEAWEKQTNNLLTPKSVRERPIPQTIHIKPTTETSYGNLLD